MKINIKKISEQTGFSPATVSNALNRKRGVNKDTSAKIFQAARELGYINDSNIQKIKLVMYKYNGLITDDTPFFPLMFDGFENECRTSGYEMAMCYLDRRAEDYEEQVRWLLNDTSSAVVLLGTEMQEEDITAFKGAKCPFLTLDYWSSDMVFNGVLINNSDSARLAVEYLINKGHKEIGYLRGSFRIKAFRSRAIGYKLTMNAHELPVPGKYTVTLATTMEGAYRDMAKYLQAKPELPTAFFSDNDMIALGAMKALQEFGYRIPEDISIIGFDDLPFCEIVTPRLTSLRVPKQEMGKIAVRRMIEIIKGDNAARTKVQVCTDFVERDSVKNIN